jgi:hypothetical protein
MSDVWVPAPPQPPSPEPPAGLPTPNSWSTVTPCAAADSPSIADGVIITGRPAVVAAMPWQITVNDGLNPPNFTIDHYDASGVLIEHPIAIAGTSGNVTLTHDPTQPLGVATKQYVDNTGLREAPMDNTTYGRDNGAWVPLPGNYMPEAPNTSQRYGRFNSTWQLDAIQADAPSDGAAYARQGGAWTAAVTGGPYLPLSGGTVTGSLTVNQVLTVQGSNSMVLNAASGNQRAILGQTSGITRWQLQLGDGTTDGLNNVGSNFSLTAYSTTGTFLGNWLTVARADGSTVLNGPVNMNAGAAVNGAFALQGPGAFILPGGTPGQVLSTNGAGVLSWATRLADAPSDGQFYTRQNAAWAVAPGGMTDAPNDGTAYARKSVGWAHLTHTDITDWTATLAPYALTASVPVASSTLPLADGVAAVGTAATYARADHVHPSDAYPHDNRVVNGDMRIDQRWNGGAGSAVGYTVDRWAYNSNQAGKIGWQRNAGGPVGFPYSLLASSASAYASLAGDYFMFYQPVEADAVSDFVWGTSGAQPVTLSFWVFSSLTGTFSGSIRNGATTRSYPFTYVIPTASVWTRIAIAIPGDTAGTWVMSGNGAGLIIAFDLGSGSTFRAPANAWAAGNFVGVTGAVSVVATNGATFYVTGVKLEIGSVATPFNRQSLAKSMADCQRYYQSIPGVLVFNSYAAAGSNLVQPFTFQTMRATPTGNVTGATGIVNCTAQAISPYGPSLFYLTHANTATGYSQWVTNVSLSAEL